MQSPFKNWGILLILLMAVALQSCGGSQGPDPEELIAKSWKLKKLNAGPEPVPLQVMTTSSFNFSKDGRYEILMGSLERGQWKLSEDKKILITIPDGLGEQHIDIEKLTENELILTNNAGQHPIRMELVPDN